MYNFVLLNNLVEPEIGIACGNTIVVMTGILLAMNMLVILVVSIKAICRMLYLRKLKKRAILLHEEKMEKRLAVLANLAKYPMRLMKI